MSRLSSSLLLSLLIASTASAVVMDWTPIGNPGNACDPQSQGCFGLVTGYAYQIGTFEVTNAQYVEFLNAKATSDPLGLYNTSMGSGTGGITQTCSPSCTYSVISGRGDMPVNVVSFYDALRFANWMHNGQGAGDTETGAYTLLGGTATPSNGTTVTRNAGAKVFLPSEDEWYKAAYHNASGLSATDYFDYPAGFDAQTTCPFPPTSAPNTANCYNGDDHFLTTDVGSYTGSSSPYGTFDQGGNVWEWNEAIINGSDRVMRGGSFFDDPFSLAASSLTSRLNTPPALELEVLGFRVAPEPGRDLLPVAGMMSVFGFTGWRRARA